MGGGRQDPDHAQERSLFLLRLWEPWKVRQGWDTVGLGSQTPLATGSKAEEAGRPVGWPSNKGSGMRASFQVERRECVPVGLGGSPGRGSERKLVCCHKYVV